MADVFFLIGLVAFTLGGAVAMHWAFGVGTVPLPRQYREPLRRIAWIPTAVAAGGLLLSATNSPLTALSPWLGIACILLAAGLRIPVPTPPPPPIATTRTVSSARHARARVTQTMSSRGVVLACGYMTGSLAWFVALVSEGGAT